MLPRPAASVVVGVHDERRRIMPAAALERNPAQLRELLDAGPPAVATEPARSDAAERHVRLIVDRAVVDVRHAGVQPPRDREPALLVSRDDAGRQSVLGVVREPHRVVLAVRDDDRRDRPERLLAEDAHLRRYVAEDRRLVEEALVPAAAEKARALRHGIVDVLGDTLQLLLVDDGADARAEIARVTALQLLRVRDELLRERLGDAAV